MRELEKADVLTAIDCLSYKRDKLLSKCDNTGLYLVNSVSDTELSELYSMYMSEVNCIDYTLDYFKNLLEVI